LTSLRQPLDQVIQSQPQTPTVVIESERKTDSNYEQHRQHRLLVQMREEQAEKVNDEDADFGRDHVRHDRADKKAFFAFEGHIAGGAVNSDIEGPPKDRGSAAGGALQLETPPQREGDCARISFHLKLLTGFTEST